MRIAKKQSGVPYYEENGRYISAIDGRTYDSAASLVATDKPKYATYRALAGRELDHRELTNGSTADEPIEDDRYRGLRVTARTDGPELSTVERAQKAAEYLAQRNATKNETAGERQQRLANEQLAKLQAEEAATVAAAEIAERPETKKNLAAARELQRRHQFLSGKKRSTLDQCERAIELATTGQSVAFQELYSELNGALVDHLQTTSKAKVEELTEEINDVNQALMEVSGE